MYRFCEKEIHRWLKEGRKPLRINGARQVGKTYLIRKVLEDTKTPYLEIDLSNRMTLPSPTMDSGSFQEWFCLWKPNSPVPREETILFFDNIQEDPEKLVKILSLVRKDSYRYLLCGPYLDTGIKKALLLPESYQELTMYPMTFLEFALAMGTKQTNLDHMEDCYRKEIPIDKRMLDLFDQYLAVGGMPDVVKTFIETSNLPSAAMVSKNILNLYRVDFLKYSSRSGSRHLRDI